MTEDKTEIAISFWAFLIDNLTPEELKELVLICLGVKSYSIKKRKIK